MEKSFIQGLANVSEVEYTKDGYVGLVHYQNGDVECYTSQLLYRFQYQENLFTLYDSKGELLKGDVSKNYHSYQNLRSGETYTQWQLVSLYLANNSTVEDRFIIDMVNEYPLQLRKFFQNTGRKLFAYTHYNILDPMMKFVLQGWCQNIVASPVLEQLIGKEKVRFLPPMFVDGVLEKEYARVTDWCIVGNMTMIKRCAWAIEAFRQVPDSQLTIYGNLPDGYSQRDLPSNVHYAGFLEEVPYEKHQGYLSCSMSECFANSAVEASAKGLICLLSDTDLAHRYYKIQSKGVTTFGDIGELILWLNAYQKEGRYASATFSKDYQKKEILEMYHYVLSLEV